MERLDPREAVAEAQSIVNRAIYISKTKQTFETIAKPWFRYKLPIDLDPYVGKIFVDLMERDLIEINPLTDQEAKEKGTIKVDSDFTEEEEPFLTIDIHTSLILSHPDFQADHQAFDAIDLLVDTMNYAVRLYFSLKSDTYYSPTS